MLGSISPPPDEEDPPPLGVCGRKELPPLTDVEPPKYCPIDKRGVVATRPLVVVPAVIFALLPETPEEGSTRTDPPRTADVVAVEPLLAAAALDALVYVPLPPKERTEEAPYAPETAVHKTQIIASVEIFRSFFITSLYLINDTIFQRIGSTLLCVKIHI